MCSVAFISGEFEGHGSVWTLFLVRKSASMRSGVVVLENGTRLLKQRESMWHEDVVDVGLGCQIPAYSHQVASSSVVDCSPQHHTACSVG